jgi:hypothetical protein
MAACTFCQTESAEGKLLTVWTGQWRGANVEVGKVTTSYGNFDVHPYWVCDACLRKRKRSIMWTVLAHIGVLVLLFALVFLIPLVGQWLHIDMNIEDLLPWSEGEMLYAALIGICFVPVIVVLSGLLWTLILMTRAPINRLKRRAKRERRQLGERVRAFSEREYERLQ